MNALRVDRELSEVDRFARFERGHDPWLQRAKDDLLEVYAKALDANDAVVE